MHESQLVFISISVLGLISLNALSYYTQKWKTLPTVIWVLILGIGYGLLSHTTHWGLPILQVTPDLVLFLFVPLLIFASAQKICLFQFKRVFLPALILGSVGILISLFLIGMTLHLLFDIELVSALLFGAIISATDPLAIGALLHGDKNATEGQKILIEGESILNDGFVVTIAGILSLILFEGESFNLVKSGESFLVHIIGAILVGIALGRGGRCTLKFWKEEHFTLKTNMTLALAFGSYGLSEAFGFSGILGVLTAALAYGYRPDKENRDIRIQKHIWEYFEYLANAVLFFLLGASVANQASFSEISLALGITGIGLLFFARFGALWILAPFLRVEGKRIKKKTFWLLNFSGARGAVSIALILLLPNSFSLKPLFLSLAFVMILFSLIAYPLALKKVLETKDTPS